ncbi:hypothetical protein [Rhodovulum sulfidophilum]|uniref:hypothetical protein n=1 Tax=Rhodovulum sulfidophilum TaxID=35806 RepID=UPI0009532956|nr:hypothetical protein [Rhodovulum sulfidophilum]OLS42857.1 hypothetical protein BV392_19615 [Rhodovulum sulfidophilum]
MKGAPLPSVRFGTASELRAALVGWIGATVPGCRVAAPEEEAGEEGLRAVLRLGDIAPVSHGEGRDLVLARATYRLDLAADGIAEAEQALVDLILEGAGHPAFAVEAVVRPDAPLPGLAIRACLERRRAAQTAPPVKIHNVELRPGRRSERQRTG